MLPVHWEGAVRVPLAVEDGHGGVLGRPAEVVERLEARARLGDVEHHNVVVQLHLHGDLVGVFFPQASQDELDLHVAERTARLGVPRQRVGRVGVADHLATRRVAVDRHHAHVHVDGRELVRLGVVEPGLLHAVVAPGHALLVGIEDILDRARNGGHKTQEKEEIRERAKRMPTREFGRLAHEAGRVLQCRACPALRPSAARAWPEL